MNPMKKVMIFSALITAPIVIALFIWLVPAIIDGQKWAAFSKVQDNKPRLSITEVENLMGHPDSIDQSESADQTVAGSVYHYHTHSRDMKVIFVNGIVFGTQFVPSTKS
jgi:hypothetical protein